MTQGIYVIQDKVSGHLSPLFLAPNDDTARRQFYMFLDGDHPIPVTDYELNLIGRFDPETLKMPIEQDTYPIKMLTDYESYNATNNRIKELTNEQKKL